MLAKFTFLLLLSAVTLPTWAQGGHRHSPGITHRAAPRPDSVGQPQGAHATLAHRAKLSDEVAESSGLAYVAGGLWTCNDGGNPPVLFRLDTASGRVVQRVRITNFTNVDWEDLTADTYYLYVGDFGNNNGDRRNLRVLRVAQASLGPADTTATAEAIEFSYPDQEDFTRHTNQHNFDCEAFFYANDSLHLFTKNWGDLQTRYYTLPAVPGAYIARLRGQFNTDGLVTAAALNAAGSVAGLLGYNAHNGNTFLWLLSDFSHYGFLQGNKRRLDLPNALITGQAEGLCFTDRYRVFVSSERFTPFFTIPQKLYTLNVKRWLQPKQSTTPRR